MKFEEALQFMRRGRHVRRRCWKYPFCIFIGGLHNDTINACVGSTKAHIGHEILDCESVMAEDWELFNPATEEK